MLAFFSFSSLLFVGFAAGLVHASNIGTYSSGNLHGFLPSSHTFRLYFLWRCHLPPK